MNYKQHDLLYKLSQHAINDKQFEILSSLKEQTKKRDLSDKQKELANNLYLQLRKQVIKNESMKLLNDLYDLNKEYIELFLNAYIEDSPLPEKDIISILKNTMYYADNFELKQRINWIFISKFL